MATVFLAGCSNSNFDAEGLLNSYAANSTKRSMLANHLTGDALLSGHQTLDLISELGLLPAGSSEFSQTEQVSNGVYLTCLDVSNTSFSDFTGAEVPLDRLERQRVRVEFSGSLIADLALLGEPC